MPVVRGNLRNRAFLLVHGDRTSGMTFGPIVDMTFGPRVARMRSLLAMTRSVLLFCALGVQLVEFIGTAI